MTSHCRTFTTFANIYDEVFLQKWLAAKSSIIDVSGGPEYASKLVNFYFLFNFSSTNSPN